MIEDDLYDLVSGLLPDHRVFVDVKIPNAKFIDVAITTDKPINNDQVKTIAEQFGVNQSSISVSKNKLLINAVLA